MSVSGLPGEVRLAREAMATRFELILRGSDPRGLRAAGEQAFHTLEELERLFSFYRPASALVRMNRTAAERTVRVHGLLRELLEQCARLHVATSGAFDPTVGPLMRLWGLTGGTPHVPSDAALAAARQRCGMRFVHLEPTGVRFDIEGVELDPGGIGKGFAIDEMALEIREAGVTDALIHGGTSSVHAIGRDEGGAWRVGIPMPPRPDSAASPDAKDGIAPSMIADSAHGEAPGLLAVVDLEDQALSVSTPYGKGANWNGTHVGHVLDPRSGRPTQGWDLAVVRCERSVDADAAATALLVLGREAYSADLFRAPGVDWMIARHGGGSRPEVISHGISPVDA